jgi:Tol biopolymer transport system component/DNA-binding winged helix-turn-helix (wHTH) protein
MYRFGPFQLDERAHELRRDHARLKIPEQCFTVLLKFIERHGELVTRDDLRKTVWPAETFVDFDTGLNKIIKQLRQILGDSADAPTYIETVPKLGYRFIAPLAPPDQSVNPSSLARSISASVLSPSEPADSAPQPFHSHWFAIALVAIVCGAAVLLVVYNRPATPRSSSEIVRLSSIAGEQGDPDFSPDGVQVAFTVHGAGENSGIHTTFVGAERSLQLTKSNDDCCPKWSPDGKSIAFARQTRDRFSILVVSPLGGTPRKVYESEELYHGVLDDPHPVSWSRDAKQLALSAAYPETNSRTVALLTLADSSIHFLTKPPPGFSDWSPVVSPDGRMVVFRRTAGPGIVDDLYIMPVQGGQPRRLTKDNVYIPSPPAWTPDSKEVIFTSNRGGLSTLWRMAVSSQDTIDEPRRLEGVGPDTYSPAVALKGERLAYIQAFANTNLWTVTLADRSHIVGPPHQLSFSKGVVGLPFFSADGTRLVFESSRTGYDEIWMANNDGSQSTQLTFLNGEAGTPRWSHDNRHVAFDYRPKGRSEIYISDVAGGTPREFVTNPGSDNVVPSWSHDDKWVYFGSTRGDGTTQIWKAPYPAGAPVQLTSNGGTGPIEGDDGFVYFTRALGSDEVWKIPKQGGAETLVMKGHGLESWADWALSPKGLYFVSRSPKRSIAFYDFKTHGITTLFEAPKDVGNPTISPDGKTLVFQQTDVIDQTIFVVNNFR